MKTAERVTLSVSVVAILLSLVTAYFQFFWRNDDLRVHWYFEGDGFPSLVFLPKTKTSDRASIRLNMSPMMVFTNAGNQNVTLRDVNFVLLQRQDAPVGNIWRHGENPPLAKCYDQSLGGAIASWERIGIDNDVKQARPIVIDPGKSVPVRIWFRQLDEAVDDSWRANSEVTGCFAFDIIDSRGRGYTRQVPALRFSSGGGSGEEHDHVIELL
jgi:hypothetical protein